MPDGVRDRKAEIWRSLLAIADAAGADWPARARAACRHFVVEHDPAELSLGVRLLADLREVFGDRDRMTTADILTALRELDEAPWADMYGKPIDARRLSKMLGKYGAKPKLVKIAGNVARGYTTEALADLWRRYLPPSVTAVTSVTALASTVTDVTQVTDTTGVPRGSTSDEALADLIAKLPAPQPCPCGRAKHSPGDWAACPHCGQSYHQYGPGRLGTCPHCPSERTAAA